MQFITNTYDSLARSLSEVTKIVHPLTVRHQRKLADARAEHIEEADHPVYLRRNCIGHLHDSLDDQLNH
jgi:hypothetical protein